MPSLLYSVDPATGLDFAKYYESTPEQVEIAIENAKSTYAAWSKLSFADRAGILKKIAGLLRDNLENLARLATCEMGKPVKQGREEVEKCATTLEYYAEYGAAMLAHEHVATEASKSYVAYRPLGIILGIMPWNFPYWQVFRAFAPIAMAGNVMLLKHASNVSGCAVEIHRIVEEASGMPGLLQTLLLPSDRVSALIDNSAIAAVTLTGSTAAGRKVAEAAGRNLKKVVLELGGSDPYIILDDADIDKVAEISVAGRLKNSGQSCVAAKRFIVTQKNADAYEAAMKQKMEASLWGDPMDEKNVVGPMARIDLRDQLHEQVTKSIAMGAKLLCGGFVPDLEGAYYPPTVLANVTKGMPAYDEELFGPVAAIIRAESEAHAIQLANDSEYGLGGAVLGNNLEVAERIALEELEAGSCFVNDFVHSDARLPFGGIKNSGYGREIGSFGIKEFVNIKTVYVK